MSAHRRIGLVTVGALIAIWLLHQAGSGSLATPPLRSWTALDAWYVRTGPAVAAVSLVRVLALGAACWLLAAGGLQLLAGVLTNERLSAAVDGVSPRLLRALAGSAASLSVTAGLAVPVLPSGAAGNPPGTAVMVPLDAPAPFPTTSIPSAIPPTPTTPTPTPTPPTSTSGSSTTTTTTTASTTTTSPAPADRAASPSTAAAPVARGGEVVVARGDSFWSIAVDEAGDRELVGYWRTLIDANRDRLVDRENPDLLYPGQVLVLP